MSHTAPTTEKGTASITTIALKADFVFMYSKHEDQEDGDGQHDLQAFGHALHVLVLAAPDQ